MSKFASYKKLTRLEFFLSRIRLFRIGNKGKVKIPLKPLYRVFFIGLAKQAYFDLTIVSLRREGIRGAIEVQAHYYSLFGREIAGAVRKYSLFADHEVSASPQRLWFTRPEGAVFVCVHIRRMKKGVDIGMSGPLALKRGAFDAVEVALAEILRSRDEMLLISAFSKAEEDCQPERAKRILERMIFIWQKPEAIRALAYIEDTRQLVANNFNFEGRYVAPIGSGVYDYVCLFSEIAEGGMPLSKRLAFECRMLEAAMETKGANSVRIPEGRDAFLRLVAAKATKAPVLCDVVDFTDLPPWIKRSEADTYINISCLDA